MDIENMTLGDAKKKLKEYKQLAQALNQPIEEPATSQFWEVGKNYFIRTVTFHYTGKLVSVSPKELVLENVAWVADSGRFHKALQTEQFEEVEMYPAKKVLVGRGAILDAVELSKIPMESK